MPVSQAAYWVLSQAYHTGALLYQLLFKTRTKRQRKVAVFPTGSLSQEKKESDVNPGLQRASVFPGHGRQPLTFQLFLLIVNVEGCAGPALIHHSFLIWSLFKNRYANGHRNTCIFILQCKRSWKYTHIHSFQYSKPQYIPRLL